MRKFVLSITAAAFLLTTPISVNMAAGQLVVPAIIAVLIGMLVPDMPKKNYLTKQEQHRFLQQIKSWKNLPATKENEDHVLKEAEKLRAEITKYKLKAVSTKEEQGHVLKEAKKIRAEIAEAKLKSTSQSTSNLQGKAVKNKGAVKGEHIPEVGITTRNASSGKVTVKDFSITKELDKSSSKLMMKTNNTGVKSNINGTTNSGMRR